MSPTGTAGGVHASVVNGESYRARAEGQGCGTRRHYIPFLSEPLGDFAKPSLPVTARTAEAGCRGVWQSDQAAFETERQGPWFLRLFLWASHFVRRRWEGQKSPEAFVKPTSGEGPLLAAVTGRGAGVRRAGSEGEAVDVWKRQKVSLMQVTPQATWSEPDGSWGQRSLASEP